MNTHAELRALNALAALVADLHTLINAVDALQHNLPDPALQHRVRRAWAAADRALDAVIARPATRSTP